ncbi:RecBCD enzyme subunit RecC, partial [Haemophilus influenzae]
GKKAKMNKSLIKYKNNNLT